MQKAAEYFKLAAEKQNAHAQNSLASCYYGGTVIKENAEEALRCFEHLAAQGNMRAQFALGAIAASY